MAAGLGIPCAAGDAAGEASLDAFLDGGGYVGFGGQGDSPAGLITL